MSRNPNVKNVAVAMRCRLQRFDDDSVDDMDDDNDSLYDPSFFRW